MSSAAILLLRAEKYWAMERKAGDFFAGLELASMA
jgi:hypothetical protein